MKKFTKIVLVIFVLLILWMGNLSVYTLVGQHKSVEKLEQGKELSFYECASIYQMHIAMWSFGWIVAPEAAMEARMMHVKHKNPVIIYSSFPSLAKPELWKGTNYNIQDPQFKYAVALNGKNFTIDRTDEYATCTLTVEYTDNVHDISGFPVNTCLFKYLQDKNWLHPYDIVYIDLKTI